MAVTEVRPFAESDLRAVFTLAKEFHAESPVYRDTPFDDEVCVTSLLNTLDPEQGAGWVAYRGGELVGALLVGIFPLFFSRHTFTSDTGFFVRPAYRGTLVAARLVKAYVQWAAQLQNNEIRIGVDSGIDNDLAVRFYHGLGFTPSGVFMVMK